MPSRCSSEATVELMAGDPYAGHDPAFIKEHARADRDELIARLNDILETAEGNTRNITKTSPLNVTANVA